MRKEKREKRKEKREKRKEKREKRKREKRKEKREKRKEIFSTLHLPSPPLPPNPRKTILSTHCRFKWNKFLNSLNLRIRALLF
jgi:hypothetical protein